MKKFLAWTTVVIVLALSFLIYWRYFNTFSEGNRAGILQKFSKKGNIFKTYEGELILSSVASTNNVTLASEKFYFSVTSDTLAERLFNLEGKHVTLHYKQKRGHLPWKGDTDYFVYGAWESEK